MFDTDGDGFISAFELGQALASLGESRTVEDLHEMIRAVDVNGDGQLDYEEFAAMLALKNEEDNMLEAFRIFGE